MWCVESALGPYALQSPCATSFTKLPGQRIISEQNFEIFGPRYSWISVIELPISAGKNADLELIFSQKE